MSRLIKSFLMPLLLAPSLALAQTQSSLVKGQYVRVVSRCEVVRGSIAQCPAPGIPWPYEWTYTGQLEVLDLDTLSIRARPNEAAIAIPTASIARLAYMEGTRGHALQGAGIGLVGGALLGGVIGSAVEFCIFSCSPATALGVIVGAPTGLLLGSVIGALIRSDRWHAVPMNDQRIRVAPRLDALGFTVAVTF